jgi:hypothetical protein
MTTSRPAQETCTATKSSDRQISLSLSDSAKLLYKGSFVKDAAFRSNPEKSKHRGSKAATLDQDRETTVEIVLSGEVLAAMCRRGRRRLRDIQASSQAVLKLDRMRGVLHVTGKKTSIADVRRQLESVTGPCIKVSGAVWAELMRTRTTLDPSQAAIERIQSESGCRIHIERTALQLRLFGPKDKVAIAQHLLDELASMVVEESVHMACSQYLSQEMLQCFASEFGVTLQVEERRIIVLGIQGAVMEAAKELRDYASDQRQFELDRQAGKPSDAARWAIEAALAKLRRSRKMYAEGALSDASTSLDSLPPVAQDDMHAPVAQMDGVVISKMPPPSSKASSSQRAQKLYASQLYHADAGPTYGDCGDFCVNCGRPSNRNPSANFCIFCGSPTMKMQLESMNGQQAVSGGSANAVYMPYQMSMMTQFIPDAPAMQVPGLQVADMSSMYNPGAPQMMSQGVPQGMVAMYVPAGMVPMQPGMSMMTGGDQAVTAMPVSPTNGIQACMVQMT